MSISININQTAIGGTSEKNTANTFQIGGVKPAEKKGNTINLNEMLGDNTVDAKRAHARQKAFKIVKDVFSGERKLDDSISYMKNRNKELLSAYGSHQQSAKEQASRISELKAEYGISDDSEEAKELALLKRETDANYHTGSPLSIDEKKQIEDIRSRGLTEYQNAALSAYDLQKYHEDLASNAKQQYEGNVAALKTIAIERLKSHAMVDASKEADAEIAAAEKELVGELVQDGMSHIEEELAEKKEQAEALEEKHEKEQELLEKAKERREETESRSEEIRESLQQDSITDDILDPKATQDAVNREIEKMLDELKLLSEDIKGSKVDELL